MDGNLIEEKSKTSGSSSVSNEYKSSKLGLSSLYATYLSPFILKLIDLEEIGSAAAAGSGETYLSPFILKLNDLEEIGTAAGSGDFLLTLFAP